MFVMGVLVAALRAITIALPARLVITTMMGSAVLAINGVVCGRLGLGLAGAPVGRRDSHPDQPFNITQIGPFLVVAK
jgi:hypothetical protein